MSVTARKPRPPATRSPKQLDAFIQQQLKPLVELASSNAKCLDDPALMHNAFHMVTKACGSEDIAKSAIVRRLLLCQHQRDELLAVLKSLRQQKPTLAWVVSREFKVDGNGRLLRFVFATPLSRAAQAPECYAVVEDVPDAAGADGRPEPPGTPPPPFLGLIDPANKLFLGPADQLPSPPLPAEILHVVSSRPETEFAGLGELEVSDGVQDHSFTLFARRQLAQEVRRKMDEDGEDVHVRSEAGIATAVHKSEDQRHEDWLEFPPLDGPSAFDLVLPLWLRREWSHDVRNIALGRSVRVMLIGPTGTGKTSAAERVGRDAFKAAAENGRHMKGVALIRVSSSHIGSSFIHQTERNLFRAFARAKALAKKDYVVIVLCDEADALLGEMDGAEHAHNRSERLAAQSLLTDQMDNVAVYLTMNVRRNSWLPAAIERRFLKRVYGRCTRRQIEAVARLYGARHPAALKKLRISADEFAGALADNLYSDRRVVATVRFYSGRQQKARARDLHNCSPGKVEDLINMFCSDVIDGAADSIDALWNLIDREFRAPNLSVRNLHDLTFLNLPHDDAVRNVELAR